MAVAKMNIWTESRSCGMLSTDITGRRISSSAAADIAFVPIGGIF